MSTVLNSIITTAPNLFGKGGSLVDVPVIDWISSTDQTQIDRVNKIRELKSNGGKYGELKNQSPIAMTSGIFKDRKVKDCFVSHSGLLCIDIDKQDNLHISNYKDLKNILSNVSEIAYLGLSVSGQGYWGLIPTKFAQGLNKEQIIKKHESIYESLIYDFGELNINLDPSSCNINRLRFWSYDPLPYINESAKIYDKAINRIIEPKYFLSKSTIGVGEKPGDAYNNSESFLELLHSIGFYEASRTSKEIIFKVEGSDNPYSAKFFFNKKQFWSWTDRVSIISSRTAYSPFSLFTIIKHGGNYNESAKELHSMGYGGDISKSFSINSSYPENRINRQFEDLF